MTEMAVLAYLDCHRCPYLLCFPDLHIAETTATQSCEWVSFVFSSGQVGPTETFLESPSDRHLGDFHFNCRENYKDVLTYYLSVTGVITHSSRPMVGRIKSSTLDMLSASTNIKPVCAGRQAPPTKYSIPNSLHRAGQSATELMPSFRSSKCVPKFSGV